MVRLQLEMVGTDDIVDHVKHGTIPLALPLLFQLSTLLLLISPTASVSLCTDNYLSGPTRSYLILPYAHLLT